MANAYQKDRRRFLLERTQQHVYGLAGDAGCGDWIDRDDKEKRLVPTRAMEKALGHLIEEYDDHVFWDLLAERLAERDLVRERGHDAVHEMTDAQYDEALRQHLDRWWGELDDHGLDRLSAPPSEGRRAE
jgi:hypothetical protein